MPDVKLELMSLAKDKGGKFSKEQLEKFLETTKEGTREEKDKKGLINDLHYTSSFNAVSDGDEFISIEDIERVSSLDGNKDNFTEKDLKEGRDLFIAAKSQKILEEEIKENKNLNRKRLIELVRRIRTEIIFYDVRRIIGALFIPAIYNFADKNGDGISKEELQKVAELDGKAGISPMDLAQIEIGDFAIECSDSVSSSFREEIAQALKEMPSYLKDFLYLTKGYPKQTKIILRKTIGELTDDFEIPVAGFYSSDEKSISFPEYYEDPPKEELVKNYDIKLIVAHEMLHGVWDRRYELKKEGDNVGFNLYSKLSDAFYDDRKNIKESDIENITTPKYKRWVKIIIKDGANHAFAYIGSILFTDEAKEFQDFVQRFFPKTRALIKEFLDKMPELVKEWKAEKIFRD